MVKEARRYCRKLAAGSPVLALHRILLPRIGKDLMECTVDGKQVRDLEEVVPEVAAGLVDDPANPVEEDAQTAADKAEAKKGKGK